LILFVNDPTAPGGMELKKRMSKYLDNVETDEILITGEAGNRTFQRKVRSIPESITKGYQSIFVLDAITFSGNTLKLAADWIHEKHLQSVVRTGVLVVSQQLVDQLQRIKDHPLKNIIYMSVTDRHEIFFPWGVTHTTSDFDRVFKSVEGSKKVHISKRPWGTIEILADEKNCSVRILTIEADEKLSFQRHLCRDELFVALDDNIGLDVCGDNLQDPIDEFDARVKSLILEKGDYILIPRGIWHRTKASKDRVRLLEVGFGLYDQVNDIERLEDKFGRVGQSGSI